MANTLKDEITNDPLARGYAGMTDEQVATSLNTADRSRNLTSISGSVIKAKIVDAEYDALTAGKKSELLSLLARDDLDPWGFDANVIKNVFGNASATLAALAGERTESISRAEELGLGTVFQGHVEGARA